MATTNGTTKQHLKIGILVPSSNTALEPLTNGILSCYAPYLSVPPTSTSPTNPLPTITVHYSRLPVTEISLTPTALNQFSTASPSDSPIIQAAKLLATANVDVIGWSGTSAGWLGFASDEKLCALIEAETGVRATTSTLALNRILREGLGWQHGGRELGMVTPYLDEVQQKIGEVYQREAGWRVVESHGGVSKNWEIAAVEEGTLKGQLREVLGRMSKDAEGRKVVSTFCTNLKAAHLAGEWEREFEEEGLLLLDTVSTVVWECLRILGRGRGEVRGWGRLFDL